MKYNIPSPIRSNASLRLSGDLYYLRQRYLVPQPIIEIESLLDRVERDLKKLVVEFNTKGTVQGESYE